MSAHSALARARTATVERTQNRTPAASRRRAGGDFATRTHIPDR